MEAEGSKFGPTGNAPRVCIWGRPGCVEEARNPVVAFLTDQSQAEIVLGEETPAAPNPAALKSIRVRLAAGLAWGAEALPYCPFSAEF